MASSGSVMFEVRTLFDTLVYHSAISSNTWMRSGTVIRVAHTLWTRTLSNVYLK